MYLETENIIEMKLKNKFITLFLVFKMHFLKPLYDFFLPKYVAFRKMRENRNRSQVCKR